MKYQFEEIENIEHVDYKDNYVYDIEVDDNSHTFIGNDILVHNSVYATYGSLFDSMTPGSQAKFDTVEKKRDFILKLNLEFLDKQNNKWCDEIFNPRHGHNIHEFESESLSLAQINLRKKNYLKAYIWSKGKYFDVNNPKLSATGIELVKSSTPGFCRDKLPKILNKLMFELNSHNKEEFTMEFIHTMQQLRREFYMSDLEYISQSVNIGNYKKFVIDDKDSLEFEKGCPTSVHAIARYNYLAHKNGHDDLIVRSGKIKYYNIKLGENRNGFFGYPSGMLPDWAPPMNKIVQWEKTVIGPINRFLEVMNIPRLLPSEAQQMSLFG